MPFNKYVSISLCVLDDFYKMIAKCIFTLVCALSLIQLHAQKNISETDFGRQEWYLYTHDRGRLYMFEKGIGKDAIIVLHGGFGAEHSYLLPAFEGLYKKHHFIFFDQRGSLRSPFADSLINVSNMVEDVETIRKKLGKEQITILGHSMGAWLASAYLEKYPSRVNKCILIAMPYIINTGEKDEERQQKISDSLFKKFMERPEGLKELNKIGIDNPDTIGLPDKQSSQVWRINFAKVNIYHIERWRQMQGGMAFYNNRTGSLAGGSLPKFWNFPEVYRKANSNIIIINGDHDFVDMMALRYPKILTAISNVKLIIIKNAGHNAWIDEPRLFQKELLKAFSGRLAVFHGKDDTMLPYEMGKEVYENYPSKNKRMIDIKGNHGASLETENWNKVISEIKPK